MQRLLVMALAAAFAPPPEATRDLLARQEACLSRMRLDFGSFLDDRRKAGWPRNYFDSWYARRLKQAGIDASLVDRLGLRLERLAPGLRPLGLTRSQADRLATTAELVL